MSKAYSSNLTLSQYQLIAPLIPPAKPGGRPRSVSMWAVLSATFDVVCQGCKWLIQQQFKGVGMRWSEPGFNHLLRLAWVNQRFDQLFGPQPLDLNCYFPKR